MPSERFACTTSLRQFWEGRCLAIITSSRSAGAIDAVNGVYQRLTALVEQNTRPHLIHGVPKTESEGGIGKPQTATRTGVPKCMLANDAAFKRT